MNCDFCGRLKDNFNTIYEDDQLIILLDIDPISTGHVLICPRQHFTDFHEMPDNLVGDMMILAKKYIVVMQSLFPAAGYSMMLNAGSFNDLKHCHLHIFPRSSAEEFSWTYSEASLPAEATDFERLKTMIGQYF